MFSELFSLANAIGVIVHAKSSKDRTDTAETIGVECLATA